MSDDDISLEIGPGGVECLAWSFSGEVYFSSSEGRDLLSVVEGSRSTLVGCNFSGDRSDVARLTNAIKHLDAALYCPDVGIQIDNVRQAVHQLDKMDSTQFAPVAVDLVTATRDLAFSNIVYLQSMHGLDDCAVASAWESFLAAPTKLQNHNPEMNHYKDALQTIQEKANITLWGPVVQVSNTGMPSIHPYLEVKDDLHLGWLEVTPDGNHTYYARSSNGGLTWWYLDASEYAGNYLDYVGLEHDNVDAVLHVTRQLEGIYILEYCHFFYVPLQPPIDFPPELLPPDGNLWGTINDPYFDQYQSYEVFKFDGRTFYKPVCNEPGVFIPPPKAPDLVITSLSVPANSREDVATTITAIVTNVGTATVSGQIATTFSANAQFLGSDVQTVNLGIDASATFTTPWTPGSARNYTIISLTDALNDVKEGNEQNNPKNTPAHAQPKYGLTIINHTHLIINGTKEIPSEVLLNNYTIKTVLTVKNIGYLPLTNLNLTIGWQDNKTTHTAQQEQTTLQPNDQHTCAGSTAFEFNLDDLLLKWEPVLLKYLPIINDFVEAFIDLVQNGEVTRIHLIDAIKDGWLLFEYEDVDGDDLKNYEEIFIYHTNPTKPDSDLDGLRDGDELWYWNDIIGIDAWKQQYDDDSLNNLLDQDSDDDGIMDGIEFTGKQWIHGTWVDKWKVVLNGVDTYFTSNPTTDTTDSDFWTDKEEYDGIPNVMYVRYRTDPRNPIDTDGDGLSDYFELNSGWPCYHEDGSEYRVYPSPLLNDSDFDGLSDSLEQSYSTNPWNPDCDGDGYWDGVEYQFGTDPKDDGQDDHGASGYNIKILIGFSVSWTSGAIIGVSTTYLFDLFDMLKLTDDGRSGYVTMYRFDGISLEFGSGVADFHFAMVIVNANNINDDPSLGGLSVSVGGQAFGFSGGLIFDAGGDSFGAYLGFTDPEAFALTVTFEKQTLLEDVQCLGQGLVANVYHFLEDLAVTLGIYE